MISGYQRFRGRGKGMIKWNRKVWGSRDTILYDTVMIDIQYALAKTHRTIYQKVNPKVNYGF